VRMASRILGLVGLWLCAPAVALASSPIYIQPVCSAKEHNFRGDFERLLNVARDQDFRSFQRINGEVDGKPYYFIKYITFASGLASTNEAFNLFAGSDGKPDENLPVIEKWTALSQKDDGEALFYVKLQRRMWNSYLPDGEFQDRESNWLIYFSKGCKISVVQETPLSWRG